MATLSTSATLQTDKRFILTDGGLETTLIYHDHFDLPYFAAFELLRRREGREALRDYYYKYLDIARKFGLPFILETPTWRANPDWAGHLGYSASDLTEVNTGSVHFMHEILSEFPDVSARISGNIGPRGDGYVPGAFMSTAEASAYHSGQIYAFARGQADHITAMTLTYSNEAIGIVAAAREAGLKAIISFTVETDGRLPGGETLQQAIETTDRATDGYADYYMINCAHPSHFTHAFRSPGSWLNRVKGIRANASARSHAELDASTQLDQGNKEELADEYHIMHHLLPEMQVIGGCCGTDHSHVESICRRLLIST